MSRYHKRGLTRAADARLFIAIDIVKKAEQGLGYKLSEDEIRDLLKDNTKWSTEKIEKTTRRLLLERVHHGTA